MKIRNANSKDLTLILDLFKETITCICSNDYSPEQIKAWTASVKNENRWLECIQNENFIVAEAQDKIVGFASLKDKEYINFMYVHKDFLRKGVAQMLFENLLKESNGKTLYSDVSITALPFFRKLGFKTLQENKNIRNGVEIINYRMAL